MSTEDAPLNEPPQHDTPIAEFAGTKRFVNSWAKWFYDVRTKINVINGLLVNFSNLSGAGFPVINPNGTFSIRTITSGIGINVDNGDGQAGNPKVYTKAQFIFTKADFPAPVAGVISLPANTTYFILAQIDLLGDRLQCAANIAFIGGSPESCGIVSTGLPGGVSLFTSTSSVDIQNINTGVATGSLFNLNDGVGSSLVWMGLRILDTPTIGTIQNYANIVMNECTVNNSANLTLDGTIASFVSQTTLWDGRPGQRTIIVPATAIFTRRFRMLYTAMVALPGETGIDFNVAATIPDDSYILDHVNFSGGGTYVAGLDYTSNKADFFANIGIRNSSAICQYSMTGNATTTVIAVAGTFVKIAGTTVAGSLNQKFNTATTNRAVYTGSRARDVRVVFFASMTSGNNQTLRVRVAKNGITISDSNMLFKTSGSGDASAIGTQTLTNLVNGDYLEAWITNDTAANNILVSDLNFIVTPQT